MALYFGLTKYLLLCALIDRAYSVPTSVHTNLLNPGNTLDSITEDQNSLQRDLLPAGNVNTYISLLLDDVQIAKYREEALKKYFVKSKPFKRENNRNELKDKGTARYSRTVAQHIYNGHAGTESPLTKRLKGSDNPAPFISVPFKAVVTITRDNVREPTDTSFHESRDADDESSPCSDKKYLRREVPGDPEFSTKSKDTSQKQRIAGLDDLLRMLKLGRKKKNGSQLKETNIEITDPKLINAAEEYTSPEVIEFENDPPVLRTNETSQGQEIDDDEEESTGSLGSIADLLPLVIPILEDLSDPNSGTDLADVVRGAIPLLGGVFGNEGMGLLSVIGPIVTRIFRGTDGDGVDIIALLTPFVEPLLTATAPFIGSIGAPIVTALLNILRNGDTLSSIVKAVSEFLVERDADGNSPVLNAIVDAGVNVLKDLRPGLPGGLDIAGIVEALTAGTITGTIGAIEASTGTGKGHKPYGSYGPYAPYGPYGPYEAGPVQAGSVNILRTSPGFVVPRLQTDLYQQKHPLDPIAVPANVAKHHRTISDRTTRRPYIKGPQIINPNPPHPLASLFQYHAAGPVQAGSMNTGSGSSSYSPYGNNGVPAYGVNPLGLVITSIKDVVGDGIQLLSSVINAVFGISGASSAADQHHGTYGPPPQRDPYKAS